MLTIYKAIRISPIHFAICIALLNEEDVFINKKGHTVCKRLYVVDIVDKDRHSIAETGYSYWQSNDCPDKEPFIYTVGRWSTDDTEMGIYYFNSWEDTIEYMRMKEWMKSFFE